jgi:AraC-like DNA-binding protein
VTYANALYRRAFSASRQFQMGDLDRLLAGSGEWLQLTPGVLQCHGATTNVPIGRITQLELNCGVQLRARVEPWRVHILLARPASGCQVLANGKKYVNGCCIVVSGEELALNILGAASIMWFDIDRYTLEGSDRAGGLKGVKAVLNWSALEWGTLATYSIDAFDGAAINVEIERAARMLLQRARLRGESAADSNREKLVRTALGLMWSSIEEPPTLRDICVAAKCSVRTLIYVFNATFGMSPMKYFKIQRLNVAHRRLQNAESSARIFDIAADCGFWHLGHFGVDYKAFFGTTPRMTPRRGITLNVLPRPIGARDAAAATMTRAGFTLALLGFLALTNAVSPIPASADTTGSFAGTVAYINKMHIGVKSGNQTRDFLISSDFDNVVSHDGSEKVPISSIKTGQFVTVQYLQSPMFGSTRATKITVGMGLTMPNTLTTPSPFPSVSPLPRR